MKASMTWFRTAVACVAAAIGMALHAANVSIGNQAYDSLNAALAAVKNGETILVVGTDAPTDVQGVANVSGKTFTIKGNGAANSTIVVGDGKPYANGDYCDYRLTGANVAFVDVTIRQNEVNKSFRGFAQASTLSFTKCTLIGVAAYWGDNVALFDGCTFDATAEYDYCLWTWGTKVMTIRDCTFNTQGKAVKMYGGGATVLNIEGCTFLSNGLHAGADKPAITINSTGYPGSDFTVNIKDSTQTGFVVGATGSALFGSDQASEVSDKIRVTVDDCVVWCNGKTLPKAVVTNLDDATRANTLFNIIDIDMGGNVDDIVIGDVVENRAADVLYKFAADPNDTNNAFKDWYADYTVKFDKDVAADSAGLVGKYGSYNIGFNAPIDVPADYPVPLLNLLSKNVNWTYEKIRVGVQEFICGAYNLSDANNSTKMTVELRLFDPSVFTSSAAVRNVELWEDGVNTFCVSKIVYQLGPAARIGSTNYKSFEEAVAAANDSTSTKGVVITLVNDCAVPEKYTAASPLALTRSMVNVNLNGRTLTVANPEALKISGSDVTFRDETYGNGGKVVCAKGNGLYVTGGNFSTMNDITIEGGVCVGGNWGDAWFADCVLVETDASAGAIRTKECGYATVDEGTTVTGALNGFGGTIDVRKGTFVDWEPSSAGSALEIVGGVFRPDPTDALFTPYVATARGTEPETWRVAPDAKYVAKIVGQDLEVIAWYDDITNAVNDIISGTVGVIVVLCDPADLVLPPNCYFKEQNGDQTVMIKYYVGGEEGGTEVSQEAYDSLEQAVDALVSVATTSGSSGSVVYPNYVPGKSYVPDNCKVVKRGNHYELSLKIFYVVEGKQYATRKAAAEAILNSPNRDTISIRVCNFNVDDAYADDSMTVEEFNDLFVTTDNGDTYTYRKEVYMCCIGTQNFPTFDKAVEAVTNNTVTGDIIVNEKFVGYAPPAGWAIRRNGDVFNLVQCVYVCEIDGQKYESAEEAIAALAAGKANGTIVVGEQWAQTLKCPNGWQVKQDGERWILAMFVSNGNGQDTDVNVGDQTSEVGDVGKVVKDSYVVAKIVDCTTVSGVRLTTISETNDVGQILVPSGIKATIDAALSNSTAFVEEYASATNVHIAVTVITTPREYEPPAAQGKTGVIAFDLKPQATVTLTEDDQVTASEVVEVTNDMIDQNQKIAVSIYTGFKPATIIHTEDDAETVIETFTGDAIAYDEETGVSTVQISHFSILKACEQEFVARIGDKNYLTLEAAFAEATDGQTIILTATSTLTNAIEIADGRHLALDMNGHDIVLDNGNIGVLNGALNMTGSGVVSGTSRGYKSVYLKGSTDPSASHYSDLTIGPNVSVKSANGYAVMISSNGGCAYGVNITANGKVEGLYGALYVNGLIQQTGGNVPVVTVNGKLLAGDDGAAVYAAGYAKWRFNAGSAVTGGAAVYAKSGDLGVAGGTFTATAAAKAFAHNGNGFDVTGDAFVVENCAGYSDLDVEVTGGTFTGADGAKAVASYASGDGAEPLAGFISGGTYSSAVDTSYCVTEFKPVDNGDGTYGVRKAVTIRNVKAVQRYPWNGLVDITFTVQAADGATLYLSAYDNASAALPMTAAKLVSGANETAIDVTDGFACAANADEVEFHLVWDSTEAVPNAKLSGVTFKVVAK